MKKRILNISLILLLGSTGSVLAQQGIGTNRPDKSAAVDIKSSNKGLLIPRMQLSWDGAKISAPTIDSPAQGLLVYNLTTVTNVPEGFYYFSNNLWNPIGVSELENSETTIITGNGTASLPYQVQVKTADSNTLGVVQIGSGINVNNGVISVPAAPGETTTLIANTLTKGNKQKIADYKNETANTPVDIFETITSITYDTATNVTHISEDTSTVVFNLGDEVRKNQKTTTVVGNGAITVNPTSPNAIGDTAYTVSVDTATTTTLGVVKPGTGITVTADGTLNVLAQADTVTTLTGVKTTGNAIGTYKNEAGTDVVINETITSIKFDSATTTLTYTPENGTDNEIVLNLGSIDTDKQQLRLDSNTLTLDRSASVDLTKYLDNTDNQSLSFDTSLHVLKITGDTNTIDFSNYKNKAYTLASDSNTISLLADGTLADSETVVKTVALDLSTDKKLTATVNGVANTTALDLSSIDTDAQQLKLDSNTLTLDRSTSVDLTKYLDNTDNQSLSFDTSLHVLKITGDTNTIDFSNYKNKAYTLASDTNTISLLADGTAVDSEAVVKDVVLELNGKNLTAKVNGVANTTALDLSTIDTDAQQLKLDSNTLTLDRSASVDLSVLRTKLDTGTNTTLTGNGTAATPYKVGVNTANGRNLGVVKEADSATTVNIGTDGSLAVNLTNTKLYGDVTGSLDSNTVEKIRGINVNGTAPVRGQVLQAVTNGNSVEWKAVYATMPKFFYVPSLVVPMDQSEVGVGNRYPYATYDSATNEFSLNLYSLYKSRFTTSVVSNPGAETEANPYFGGFPAETASNLPIVPLSLLDFFITYYDSNILQNVTIDNNGVMKYKVSATGQVSEDSFMNIVLKIRDTER